MSYADNQGVRIHYKVEGEGPPLVLRHGSTLSIDSWYQRGYVEPLKPDYQLILIDTRGHGGSDKPHDRAAYALPSHVGDTVAVLDDLGIEKAHYFGYSIGGWIGFGMAKYAAHRVQSFTICAAHPYAESAGAFRHVDGTDPEAFFVAFEKGLGMRLTPEMKEQVIANNDLRALAASRQDRDSLEDILPTMTMPCFLFVGEEDPRFPKVQECVKQMPNATFMSFPGLNHRQSNVRSDLVLPHISKFLQENS